MRVELGLLASPAYLAAHGTPSTLAELGEHKLLSWRAAGRHADAWPLLDGAAVPVEPAVISANAELLARLADQGGGIALLPGPSELFHPPELELVPVLADVVGGELALRALSPQPSHADPRLRALVENAQSLLAAMALD